MKFKFYSDPQRDNNWYVDLPDYPGDKEDLQMVCGADVMLEIIAQGETTVFINILEEIPEKYDWKLELTKECSSVTGGADYLGTHKLISQPLEIWLCDVTQFVFNCFPKTLYITQ